MGIKSFESFDINENKEKSDKEKLQEIRELCNKILKTDAIYQTDDDPQYDEGHDAGAQSVADQIMEIIGN